MHAVREKYRRQLGDVGAGGVNYYLSILPTFESSSLATTLVAGECPAEIGECGRSRAQTKMAFDTSSPLLPKRALWRCGARFGVAVVAGSLALAPPGRPYVLHQKKRWWFLLTHFSWNSI